MITNGFNGLCDMSNKLPTKDKAKPLKIGQKKRHVLAYQGYKTNVVASYLKNVSGAKFCVEMNLRLEIKMPSDHSFTVPRFL